MKKSSIKPWGGKFRYVILLMLIASSRGYTQEQSVDFNTLYRFPISIGFEYHSLKPFAQYNPQFNIYSLSANLRWPIPAIPSLQPSLKMGMIRFDSQDLINPLKWDHTHWYGSVGLVYAYRFAKNFEIGLEALAGFSEAVFQNLIPEVGTTGSSNLIFETGARIALNPSYNISIDVQPNLKYLLSLSPLKDFNGFLFGIGFSAAYRFGQDPDNPGALIRSIRFSQVEVPDLFAAMQSYYAKNPIGTVVITNTEKHPVTDLEVSFFQAGYMDSPTPADTIEALEAGESLEIPLFASFNQEVFTTEGITPLTGEVMVKYKSRGKPAEQRQSVSYDLHDKTSVTWDDDRKVAAYITPSDSALRNYASFIRQISKEEVVPAYNDSLQFAVQLYHALKEIGCLYQSDPILPFTKVQENPQVVDSINLPRDTLKRITGDCDDLTVLYCSLLETIGIESGFITVPGHIYPVFNTKVPAREYMQLHPDRKMTINLDGELWVPVEITLVGKTSFMDAWRQGIDEWQAYEAEPTKRGFHQTRNSQELFRPVGLRETDLGLQYGRETTIVAGFQGEMNGLIDAVLSEYRQRAVSSRTARAYNELGIMYAKYRRFQQAEQAFQDAMRQDRRFLGAQVNLANLQYLKKDYRGALRSYQQVYQNLQSDGKGESSIAVKVLLNMGRAYQQLDQFDNAQQYFAQAKSIDAGQVQQYNFVAQSAGNGETRAAEMRDPSKDIVFVSEEE